MLTEQGSAATREQTTISSGPTPHSEETWSPIFGAAYLFCRSPREHQTRWLGALFSNLGRHLLAVLRSAQRLVKANKPLRPRIRLGRSRSAPASLTGPMASPPTLRLQSSGATCPGLPPEPNPLSVFLLCRTCTASLRRTDCSSSVIMPAAQISIPISTG